MPSFPLTLPSTPGISKCRVSRQTIVAINESPYTFQQQVYVHPGKRWHITLDFPPMTSAQSAAWIQFFYDLGGREGTFNFNLNRYCTSLSPAPGTRVFRLLDNTQGWDVDLAQHYGFVIQASEVVT